jgi:sporulation protein YlmC with PRC-barrel domain
MKTICDLQFLEVVSDRGEKLGRVFELRSDGIPEHGIMHPYRRITQLVYGKTGLMERLGLRQAQACIVSWSAVVSIDEHTLTVRHEDLPRKC